MSTTLEGLFTEIADAIRTKTGGTDTIPAVEMPTRILGITSGGSNGNVDPASFQSYQMTRFLAVSENNVNFYVSTNVWPSLPQIVVIPCVQNTDWEMGGSFVMVRDEELGYRLFYNGNELEHAGYTDSCSDDALSMTIYFNYDYPLVASPMDETERVLYWF